MREARSGTEDLTVRAASGECVLLFVFEALTSLDGSTTGVEVRGLRGSDVKARGADMADMTPPKAE